MTELTYKNPLHGNFYRFDVKDVGINGFSEGYVDIEIEKRTGRISVHGLEHGGSPMVVSELTKIFNNNKDHVIEQINERRRI